MRAIKLIGVLLYFLDCAGAVWIDARSIKRLRIHVAGNLVNDFGVEGFFAANGANDSRLRRHAGPEAGNAHLLGQILGRLAARFVQIIFIHRDGEAHFVRVEWFNLEVHGCLFLNDGDGGT